MAAAIHAEPGASRMDMPRVKRALKGALKMVPPQSRLPMPEAILGAMIGAMVARGHRVLAIMAGTGLGFQCSGQEAARSSASWRPLA